MNIQAHLTIIYNVFRLKIMLLRSYFVSMMFNHLEGGLENFKKKLFRTFFSFKGKEDNVSVRVETTCIDFFPQCMSVNGI